MAQIRFYTKRNHETSYRFLGFGSSRDVLSDLPLEPHQRKKQRRNPVALAQEWQQRIDNGEVPSRAALAREIGVTRAHVTQVMRLLRLPPNLQEAVLALGAPIIGRQIGAHTLRSLIKLPHKEQERRVGELLGRDQP